MERLLTQEALARHNGNRNRAASDLGINTSSLYRKMISLKIDLPWTDGRSRPTQ